MGKHNKSKKRKNSSEGSSGQQKNARNGGPPDKIAVSDTLHQVNSVLFNCDNDETVELSNSVFEPDQRSSLSDASGSMSPSIISDGADPSNLPTNLDLFKYLKQMDSKINIMDKKLEKLDTLEKKVC